MDHYLERNLRNGLTLMFRAGLVFLSPIEVFKCRAQLMTDKHLKIGTYIPHMVKTEGYRSLYKGSLALLIRDTPAWGSYFYSYELLKEWASYF